VCVVYVLYVLYVCVVLCVYVVCGLYVLCLHVVCVGSRFCVCCVPICELCTCGVSVV
jgi:hypothetical protein